MSSFSDIHQQFLANSHTTKNIRKDFAEWHQGRPLYACWVIDVDTVHLRTVVDAAAGHLKQFLLDGYCRQPHITIGISGFISNPLAHEWNKQADEYDIVDLERNIAALTDLNIQPFPIKIGGLASFSSAPFLQVEDSTDSLQQLHDCLHHECLRHDFQRHDFERLAGKELNVHYIPHVTIGLYSNPWSTQAVSAFMRSYSQTAQTVYWVEKISLMAYRTAEIGGKLIRIADVDLLHKETHWHHRNLFQL